jgi:TonB family protein
LRGHKLVSSNPPFSFAFFPIVLVLLAVAGVCAQAHATVDERRTLKESTSPQTQTPQQTPAQGKTQQSGTAQPSASPAQSVDVMVRSEAPPHAEEPQPQSLSPVEMKIARARALAAAHRLPAAANELEAVRRSAADEVSRNVTSVLLMGIYLEDGNYVRAESLLEEDFQARASRKDASLRTYFATAGQAVNGARAHLTRYRMFGINVADSELPPESVADLDRLRLLLERMVAQAKEIASQRKAYDALALLEDVSGLRLSLARDDEDRGKWEAEYANARESLASSQSQIASLNGIPSLRRSITTTSGSTTAPVKEPPVTVVEPNANSIPTPAAPKSAEPRAAEKKTTETKKSSALEKKTTETKKPSAAEKQTKEVDKVSTGALNSRATKRVVPTYPPLAKSSGAEGTVRVYVIIDESGKVAEVTSVDGPLLLKQSAEDAARQWRFSPTVKDGKVVRLGGFIEFNFTK